jgi:hypothetical protein
MIEQKNNILHGAFFRDFIVTTSLFFPLHKPTKLSQNKTPKQNKKTRKKATNKVLNKKGQPK